PISQYPSKPAASEGNRSGAEMASPNVQENPTTTPNKSTLPSGSTAQTSGLMEPMRFMSGSSSESPRPSSTPSWPATTTSVVTQTPMTSAARICRGSALVSSPHRSMTDPRAARASEVSTLAPGHMP